MDTVSLPPPFINKPHDEKLSRGLTISIAVHVALALLIIFKNLVFPGKPVAYIPALRVDLVGLPTQLKREMLNPSKEIKEIIQAKPAPAPHAAHAPSPPKTMAEPNEMVLKPTKQSEKYREKRLKSSLERIKSLAKISALDTQTPAQATPIMGNKISKGTSLSAEARESDRENYIDTLQNALQQNWALPMWLERQQLNAKVMIFVDASGRLIQFRFVQSSGNPQFDEAVKRTLMQSQPFPAPPSDVAPTLSSNGVLVGFPL
ncbi:MAG: TonB family protein [Oligoflexia bacterium]|nr:TonB family protein [Oligoflexia bacterium]